MVNHDRGPASTPPLVLVIARKSLADRFEAVLSGDYRVRTASTPDAVYERFDADVDVAVFEVLPSISTQVLLSLPVGVESDPRTVMVTDEQPPDAVLSAGLDRYLLAPVSAAALCDAVESLSDSVSVHALRRRLSELTVRRNVLDQEQSLSSTDHGEEVAAIEHEMGQLHRRLADADPQLAAVGPSAPASTVGTANRKTAAEHSRPD